MERTVLAWLAGMALGTGHFSLFRWSTTRILRGGAGGRLALLLFLALRQLVLLLAFLGVWRALRLPPVPMALGIAVAYALLRGVMVWQLHAARGRQPP